MAVASPRTMKPWALNPKSPKAPPREGRSPFFFHREAMRFRRCRDTRPDVASFRFLLIAPIDAA